MDHESRTDDLDRLFAAMQSPAPRADILEKALAEVAVRRGRKAFRVAIIGYVVVLIAIAVSSFALGRVLATSGATDLIGMLRDDPSWFAEAPWDIFAVLTEMVSWGLIITLAVMWLALLWWSYRLRGVFHPRIREGG